MTDDQCLFLRRQLPRDDADRMLFLDQGLEIKGRNLQWQFCRRAGRAPIQCGDLKTKDFHASAVEPRSDLLGCAGSCPRRSAAVGWAKDIVSAKPDSMTSYRP